jgi:hypothetical protein
MTGRQEQACDTGICLKLCPEILPHGCEVNMLLSIKSLQILMREWPASNRWFQVCPSLPSCW